LAEIEAEFERIGIAALDPSNGPTLGQLIEFMEGVERLESRAERHFDGPLTRPDVYHPAAIFSGRLSIDDIVTKDRRRLLTGSNVDLFTLLCNERAYDAVSVAALIALRTEACKATGLPLSEVNAMRSCELAAILQSVPAVGNAVIPDAPTGIHSAKMCGDRLRIDLATRAVVLDGEHFEVANPTALQFLAVVWESKGAKVATDDIRGRVRGCAGRPGLMLDRSLPPKLRDIIKGCGGRAGGAFSIVLPRLRENCAPKRSKGTSKRMDR
jgi:hypothetical protein